MIEKIIHQMGPTNKNEWHPAWFKCQKSWKDNFPDFEYILWNDETLDKFIKNTYPEYWNVYDQFPVHIMKIDFSRFCILDTFGGIYADLDYFCYKNFYHLLNEDCYIVENALGNDPVENSLMCASKSTTFFKECMDNAVEKFLFVKKRYPDYFSKIKTISNDINSNARSNMIMYISGTNLLYSAFKQTKNLVSTLSSFHFNNIPYSYDETFYAKHIHTGVWGREDILRKRNTKNTFSNFDFFKDYTNGKFKNLNFKFEDRNYYDNDLLVKEFEYN